MKNSGSRKPLVSPYCTNSGFLEWGVAIGEKWLFLDRPHGVQGAQGTQSVQCVKRVTGLGREVQQGTRKSAGEQQSRSVSTSVDV